MWSRRDSKGKLLQARGNMLDLTSAGLVLVLPFTLPTVGSGSYLCRSFVPHTDYRHQSIGGKSLVWHQTWGGWRVSKVASLLGRRWKGKSVRGRGRGSKERRWSWVLLWKVKRGYGCVCSFCGIEVKGILGAGGDVKGKDCYREKGLGYWMLYDGTGASLW